jgi:hypothetical protein
MFCASTLMALLFLLKGIHHSLFFQILGQLGMDGLLLPVTMCSTLAFTTIPCQRNKLPEQQKSLTSPLATLAVAA